MKDGRQRVSGGFEKSVVAGHVKPGAVPLSSRAQRGDGNIGGHPLNQSNDSRRRRRPYVFSLNRPINRRNRLLIEWSQVDCRSLSQTTDQGSSSSRSTSFSFLSNKLASVCEKAS